MCFAFTLFFFDFKNCHNISYDNRRLYITYQQIFAKYTCLARRYLIKPVVHPCCRCGNQLNLILSEPIGQFPNESQFRKRLHLYSDSTLAYSWDKNQDKKILRSTFLIHAVLNVYEMPSSATGNSKFYPAQNPRTSSPTYKNKDRRPSFRALPSICLGDFFVSVMASSR